jgi:general secretion pathway protein M
MTMSAASTPGLARRQTFAALALIGVVAGLTALAVLFVDDLLVRADAVAALRERLARLEGGAKPGHAGAGDPQAMGSPFLEGQTITVAGAALQQRVDAAVARARGAVVSSQVEIDGPQAKDGFVSLTENIEIAQPALQKLLYDIEAGMPYLFVDTLGVQTPQGEGNPESARLVVVMGVTGQWQPER